MKKQIQIFLFVTIFLATGSLFAAQYVPGSEASLKAMELGPDGALNAMGGTGEVDASPIPCPEIKCEGLSAFMRSLASRLCGNRRKVVVTTALVLTVISAAVLALKARDYEKFTEHRENLESLLSRASSAVYQELRCHWCVIKSIFGYDAANVAKDL